MRLSLDTHIRTGTDSSSVSRYPALDRDLTVDVVVIGAGITGLTAAYLLKRSGLTVAVHRSPPLRRRRLAASRPRTSPA